MKKPRRFQLKEYRDYVRGLKSCAVNPNHEGPWESHHLDKGGMGTKGSDLMCICMCRDCHVLEQIQGRKRVESMYGLESRWFEVAALRTLVGWVEGLLDEP